MSTIEPNPHALTDHCRYCAEDIQPVFTRRGATWIHVASTETSLSSDGTHQAEPNPASDLYEYECGNGHATYSVKPVAACPARHRGLVCDAEFRRVGDGSRRPKVVVA